MALHRGPWNPNASYLPLPSRAVSTDGLKTVPTPSPPCTPSNVPWHAVFPGRKATQPVIRRSYDTSDCVPASRNRRKTIPTIFPTFTFQPTLSKNFKRMVNDPSSQTTSKSAIMPSSAYKREFLCMPSYMRPPFLHVPYSITSTPILICVS